MDKLDKLKHCKHEVLKELVIKALRNTESGRCSQETVVKKICQIRGVQTLRGKPRGEFTVKVNRAISALLRENPPRIERCGSGNRWIRLA